MTRNTFSPSFTAWRENADMPTRDANGRWYDAEDGCYFSAEAPRKATGTAKDPAYKSKIAAAREQAAAAGWATLEGSVAQCEWAETIRAELVNANDVQHDIRSGLKFVTSAKDLIDFFLARKQGGRLTQAEMKIRCAIVAGKREAEVLELARQTVEQAKATQQELFSIAHTMPAAAASDNLGDKVAETELQDGTHLSIFVHSKFGVRFIFKKDGVRTHHLTADEAVIEKAKSVRNIIYLPESMRLQAAVEKAKLVR